MMLIVSWLLGVPSVALADVTACVQAHTSGQREAKAGHLKAASEAFASCVSRDGCPDAIRSECADFYKTTERNIPTLIFAGLDQTGSDLIEVRVFADDQLLTERLDGRPIALDPGEHHIRYELPSGQVLESEVLVREGEKNRIVSLRAKAAAQSDAEASAPNPETRGSDRKLPTSFWVASSLSAAGLVSFGAFAALGHGKQKSLDACSPNCSADQQADYDAMRRDYLFADISLGIGLASAGVATWLFLSHDRSRKAEHARASQPPRFTIIPLVSTRSAGLVLNADAF